MNIKEDNAVNRDQWVQEAKAVIKDIGHHVDLVEISKELPNTNRTIYLNLRTLEKNQFCIEISGEGFQIVGNRFNDNSCPREVFYETPYSLLDNISCHFKDSFSNELISKLNVLADEQNNISKS